MKKLAALVSTIGLLLLVNGCEAPGAYGGASVGVVGEYPSTFSGGYYSYPGYTPYPYHYRAWAPYDRDHYWDRNHYWDRHNYRYGRRDWDDRHHH